MVYIIHDMEKWVNPGGLKFCRIWNKVEEMRGNLIIYEEAL